METLRIEIINPKAKKIIKDLADLNLINIREKNTVKSFGTLLNKMRTKSKTERISLDEITKEVEFVRSRRYAKKG
jgi:hypothetical protein